MSAAANNLTPVNHPPLSLFDQHAEIGIYFKIDANGDAISRTFIESMVQASRSRLPEGHKFETACKAVTHYVGVSNQIRCFESSAEKLRVLFRILSIAAVVFGIAGSTGILAVTLPASLCIIVSLVAIGILCRVGAGVYNNRASLKRQEFLSLRPGITQLTAQFNDEKIKLSQHIHAHHIIKEALCLLSNLPGDQLATEITRKFRKICEEGHTFVNVREIKIDQIKENPQHVLKDIICFKDNIFLPHFQALKNLARLENRNIPGFEEALDAGNFRDRFLSGNIPQANAFLEDMERLAINELQLSAIDKCAALCQENGADLTTILKDRLHQEEEAISRILQ